MGKRLWTFRELKIVTEMVANNNSYQEISDRIGRSPSAIYEKLRAHDLPKIRTRQINHSAPDISIVMELWRSGKSYSEIAKITGRTRSAVAGIVYRNRNRHDTTRES